MGEIEGLRAFVTIPAEPPRAWIERIAKDLAIGTGKPPTSAHRWDALMAYRAIAALAEAAAGTDRDG